MVNFMCQLDWTMERQTFGQTWLCVCVHLWGVESEIHIWVSRLRNTVGLPSCGWASANPLKAWVEEKSDTPVSERELILSDRPWAAISVFSCFWTKTKTSAFWVSDLPVFRLRSYHQCFWFSGLQIWTGTASVLLGLQLADHRSNNLSFHDGLNQFFIINLYVNTCMHAYVYSVGFASLEDPAAKGNLVFFRFSHEVSQNFT